MKSLLENNITESKTSTPCSNYQKENALPMNRTRCESALMEILQILSFSRRSENCHWVLQWWSVRKNIFKHKFINNQYICSKNNTVHTIEIYLRERTYVGFFSFYLVMSLIFTSYQQCKRLRPTSCWKYVNIRAILW